MNFINHVVALWPVIAPVILLIISEWMGANPNYKYNGILDAIVGMISKQTPPTE